MRLLPLVLLILAGCATCPYRAAYDCLGSDLCPEADGCSRKQVVCILIGPELDLGWSKLTTKIHQAGYAKVLSGSALKMPLLVDHAKRIAQEEPDTRFVVVGYDFGTYAAQELIFELSAQELSVDHCIYLDPWTTVARRPLPPTVAVTVVRSHGWTKGLFLDASDQILPGVGHYDLPTHELTVAAITSRLSESAQSVVREEPSPARFDPTQPIVPASRPGHLGSDWDFLLGPSAQPKPSKPQIIPERTAGLIRE